ncbi:sorbitol dehydrogenase-like [Diorhabda carinulata]|uniref:sorbitol dehydrogenase-like n=1 Tax=Diorhabda carinulata TaxID=1163345 RepID=UPI0025A2490F|nr:sorbitol dehydrogenase-like [Diorhabda carinulata]
MSLSNFFRYTKFNVYKWFNRIARRYESKNCKHKNDKRKGGNLSAVLTKVKEIKMEDRPIPIPNSNEVLLQMEVVGICGSDVHYWQHGKIGPFELKKPMVLGHEGSGSVVKFGSNVSNLQQGDKVAIEPGIPCRTCEYCKTGRYNICPDMRFCATPPYDGNLCRYYCTDADFCYKLPCGVSLEEGALCEPLAVGVHANKLAKTRIGSICFVQGAGPVGLCTAAVAKAFGASKVLVSDVFDYRLAKAQKLGVADFILNTSDMEELDVSYKVLELLQEEPHSTFECAGTVSCARMGLHVTRAGGIVVLLGMGADEISLPFIASLVKEITIIGSFRYVNDYPDAIELLKSKRVDIKDMVTHHYSLEQAIKAFEAQRDHIGEPVKILIHCNPNWKPCT